MTRRRPRCRPVFACAGWPTGTSTTPACSTSSSKATTSSPGKYLRRGPRRALSPVAVLLVPLHLDRLEDAFVGGLGIVGEPRQLRDPLAKIREAHGQGIGVRIPLHERDRDVLGVFP